MGHRRRCRRPRPAGFAPSRRWRLGPAGAGRLSLRRQSRLRAPLAGRFVVADGASATTKTPQILSSIAPAMPARWSATRKRVARWSRWGSPFRCSLPFRICPPEPPKVAGPLVSQSKLPRQPAQPAPYPRRPAGGSGNARLRIPGCHGTLQLAAALRADGGRRLRARRLRRADYQTKGGNYDQQNHPHPRPRGRRGSAPAPPEDSPEGSLQRHSRRWRFPSTRYVPSNN
uniref:Uncharacterized protein n=1 Tax=Rhodocyclus tenuis TaxID=1066 RepID=A0A840G7V4_RHOTE|nr:hypothetical protein [Rhodocyclus tenuis]